MKFISIFLVCPSSWLRTWWRVFIADFVYVNFLLGILQRRIYDPINHVWWSVCWLFFPKISFVGVGEGPKYSSVKTLWNEKTVKLFNPSPFKPNAPFLYLLKHQKTKGFLTFSSGIRMEHWTKLGYSRSFWAISSSCKTCLGEEKLLSNTRSTQKNIF